MINKEKVVNYVKTRNRFLSSRRIGNIDLFIKDQFTTKIDLNRVFTKINNILPTHILNLVDVVYVGEFDFLKEKMVNAVYMDGAIYTSNVQDNENDFLDDIIHEYSHACEETYSSIIYADGEIEDEFLLKRKRLKRILLFEGYDVDHYDFTITEYDQNLDILMYQIIGYKTIRTLAKNLFLGPYSVTSLREYFARGFEEYYLGKKAYLRDMCPYVYSKLYILNNDSELVEEEDYEI